MRSLLSILIFSGALLFALPIWGAPKEDTSLVDPEKPKSRQRVVYKKRERHKFGGLSLKGQIKKPDLDYIYKRKGLRQEKIVNIPENFNHEIIQGAGQF